jgi:hypothetical protein
LASELASARAEAQRVKEAAAEEAAAQRARLAREQEAFAAQRAAWEARLGAVEEEKRAADEERRAAERRQRQAERLLTDVFHPGVLVTVQPAPPPVSAEGGDDLDLSLSVGVFPGLEGLEGAATGAAPRQGVVLGRTGDGLAVTVRYTPPDGSHSHGHSHSQEEGEVEEGVALDRLQIFIPPPVVIVLPPPPSDADIVRNVLDIVIAQVQPYLITSSPSSSPYLTDIVRNVLDIVVAQVPPACLLPCLP